MKLCDTYKIEERSDHVLIAHKDSAVFERGTEELFDVFNMFNEVGLVSVNPLIKPAASSYVFEFDPGSIITSCLLSTVASPANESLRAKHLDYARLTPLFVPKRVWQELDCFCEIYMDSLSMEVSLCYQIIERGYRCLYVPLNNVTDRQDRHAGQHHDIVDSLILKKNWLRLKARWHRPLAQKHSIQCKQIEANISSDIRHALFLDLETPRPDTNAGGYAAIKEMQILQSLGYQITFLPKNFEYDGWYTDALQRMGIECINAQYYADTDEFLRNRGNEFCLIYITRYHVARSILPKLRQYVPTARIVLMLADLHFLRELRAALHNRDDEQLSQAMETRENELAVMRKVDLVLSYSDVEKTVILSHNLASTKVAKCPWVCDVVESVSGFENRVDIAFLGGFNHSPNVEAMVWFIEQVWPDLLEQLPEAQLRIYGSAIPQSIKDLAAAKARIQVHGWVSDVASVYNSCRVFIAPLQSGAGIKGKVIGALAHGVPSVLSDIAVEGIGVCDEIHAFVASSPDEWVNRIMMLYTDQALWEQMSQHALNFAKRNYSLDKAIVEMKAALSTVGIEPILEPKALVWKGPWRSVAQV